MAAFALKSVNERRHDRAVNEGVDNLFLLIRHAGGSYHKAVSLCSTLRQSTDLTCVQKPANRAEWDLRIDGAEAPRPTVDSSRTGLRPTAARTAVSPARSIQACRRLRRQEAPVILQFNRSCAKPATSTIPVAVIRRIDAIHAIVRALQGLSPADAALVVRAARKAARQAKSA